MRRLVFLWTCVYLGIAGQLLAGPLPQFPKDLSSPLSIPMSLAGSFGELRSQHYHSGWDLKTDEKIGLPVRSIADGEITRVKISPEGYGWVLYVFHPQWNMVSVYAHLSDFRSDVANWIRDEQYKSQSYSVDITPPTGMFSVKREENIGLSGNTGSSGGPHLHFEVRNATTEHPIDPHLLGYSVADITRPVIQRLWILPQGTPEPPLSIDFNFGGEAFGKDSLYEVAPVFGVGIEAYDYVLSADNKCGIQHIITLLDGNIISEWQVDSLEFEKTHHINGHILKHPKLKDTQFHRCYLPPGAPEDHFLYTEKKGIVTIKDTLLHAITVMVADFSGNATCVYAYVQNHEVFKGKGPVGTEIDWEKGGNLTGKAVELVIGQNDLYENTTIQLKEGVDVFRGDSLAYFQWLPNEQLWAQKPTVRYIQKDILTDRQGWINEWTGDWKAMDSLGCAKVMQPGRYFLIQDTIPPMVSRDINRPLPSDFKKDNTRFYAWLKDEVSGIKNVNATVNGKWVLLYYDAKNQLIFLDPHYVFDTPQIELSVTATDKAGNTSTSWFTVNKTVVNKH